MLDATDNSYDQFLILLSHLGLLVVVAFVIERILDFVFDYKLIRERIADRGIKAPIALALSLGICFWRDLDIFAALFGDAQVTTPGIILTGLFLAGGSGAAMTLFHNILGLSQSLKRERREMARLEQQNRSREVLLQNYRRQPPGSDPSRPRKLTFTGSEDLTAGSAGPEVVGLQYALNALGYLDSGFELGRFCKATQRAVQKYQQAASLVSDGVVGPKSKAQLLSRCCGVSDRNTRLAAGAAASGECRWHDPVITYCLENLTPDLPADRCRTLISEAFDTWASAADLRFREVPDPASAKIRIRWSDPTALPEIGPMHVFAYAFYPPPRGQPTPGLVVFDNSDRWLDDDAPPGLDGQNLRLVATHEIGHALGLDHSENRADIMFRYPQAAGPRPLSGTDLTSIRNLYGTG